MILNSVPNTKLDPNNLVDSFQTIFGVNDLEMVMYIAILAIFTFVYKEMKTFFAQQKSKMNNEIELMLIHFCEIINTSINVNKHDEIEIKNLFDEIRRSYPFIDYNLYKEFDKIITSDTLSNSIKVEKIRGITENQIKDLSFIKNKNLDYSITKPTPFIERLLVGITDIFKPIVLTVVLLITSYFLLLSIISQTTLIEMIATPFSLILGFWLIYFFVTLIPHKEFTSISGFLYLSSIILFFVLSIVDGMYFNIVLVLLFLFCGSFFMKKHKENQEKLKIELDEQLPE